MTQILTSLDTRGISGEGVFRVRPHMNVMSILRAAEAWGPGSWVVFYPGEYEFRETFEFYNIAAIVGFGINSVRFKRWENTIFKSVWKYAEWQAAPRLGGFNIQNMVDTDEPALELGGAQNICLSDIFSWGPGGLVRFVNAEAVENPPLGKPFGTWTENIVMRRIIVSGPKLSAISFRVEDPNRRFQSFSNFKSEMIQIALSEPGSIGIDMGDHTHFYSGHLAAKFNIEASAQGLATCLKIGPQSNVLCNHYEMYVEGVPLRDVEGFILAKAGLRIDLDPTARMTGTGSFWRQDPAAVSDLIVAGTTWDGREAGFIQDGILKDQIA